MDFGGFRKVPRQNTQGVRVNLAAAYQSTEKTLWFLNNISIHEACTHSNFLNLISPLIIMNTISLLMETYWQHLKCHLLLIWSSWNPKLTNQIMLIRCVCVCVQNIGICTMKSHMFDIHVIFVIVFVISHWLCQNCFMGVRQQQANCIAYANNCNNF